MADEHPYLTLVDPNNTTEEPGEFVPLPFYPWDQRPAHLVLDADEVATAIHLSAGDLIAAAELLRVPLVRVARALKAHPRLQRVMDEATHCAVARAAAEYIRALSSPNDRRREWGASQIMRSRAAQAHPFAPAPAGQTQSSTSVTVTPRAITFRWRTDADDASQTDTITLEGEDLSA